MIVRSVRSRSISPSQRLDARYFLSPGTQAEERLRRAFATGVPHQTLVEAGARVWAPKRFKRAYAAQSEPSLPYLRPYDVFDYVPQPADYLSIARTKDLSAYRVEIGTILQTCSGRNLGPAVMVDRHLEKFVVSHDLIRIDIDDEPLRLYTLAILGTPTLQALLRRDKTGSVIDHISVSHVERLLLPFFGGDIEERATAAMRTAIQKRESARTSLTDMILDYERQLPEFGSRPLAWSVSVQSVGGRLDSAPQSPIVQQIRDDLLTVGGVPLVEVAEVLKPAGRYKTLYVKPAFGRPLMSGRQALQAAPINLQFMSPRSFDDPAKYEVQPEWTIFQADGRAEERLGYPVMVTNDRLKWLASGHIGRLVPREGVDPGYLYLAAATKHVQTQIGAIARGSVVDALYPEDIEQIVLPPPVGADAEGARRAWSLFSKAQWTQDQATALLEDELSRLTGERQIDPMALSDA